MLDPSPYPKLRDQFRSIEIIYEITLFLLDLGLEIPRKARYLSCQKPFSATAGDRGQKEIGLKKSREKLQDELLGAVKTAAELVSRTWDAGGLLVTFGENL